MAYSVYHRDNCRLCNSENVRLVVKLEPIPPQEMYFSTSEEARAVERFPIDVYMCEACGHVQQLDILDSETLWDDYTYLSSNSEGMTTHFEHIAKDLIKNKKPRAGSLIIDIGSNDGSLLRPFKNAGYTVLGVDPAKELARIANESGIPTIDELFTFELAKEIVVTNGYASIVTAFNSYAHADDLENITRGIVKLLDKDGYFVFEVQYLLDVIEKMLIGTIFHEHMSHHSLKPLSKFLERLGLTVTRVTRYDDIQHGSLVGVAQRTTENPVVEESVFEVLRLENRAKLDQLSSMYQFNDRLQQIRQHVSSLVMDWKKKNFTIAGYGAARSGQTLISQLGFQGVIEYIFDDNENKVHRFPGGDGIEVIPTKQIYIRMPDIVIILAWVHSQSIIRQHREYLKNGGHFVIVSPNIEIV